MEENKNKTRKIKYTTVLPVKLIDELKVLTHLEIIPSLNQGIVNAIELFLSEIKKEAYKKQMEEAAKDQRFLKRTLEIHSPFEQNEEITEES